jgi:hypothetical protein
MKHRTTQLLGRGSTIHARSGSDPDPIYVIPSVYLSYASAQVFRRVRWQRHARRRRVRNSEWGDVLGRLLVGYDGHIYIQHTTWVQLVKCGNAMCSARHAACRMSCAAHCRVLHAAPHAPWPHAYEPECAVVPAMTDPGGTSSRNAPALCGHAGPRPRGVHSCACTFGVRAVDAVVRALEECGVRRPARDACNTWRDTCHTAGEEPSML